MIKQRLQKSKRELYREVGQLRAERNEAVIKYNNLNKAADEVNMVVDAILAGVIRALGTDGEIVIDAPKTSRKKQVEAEKTDDGKLIIRLRREKDETEGSNPEG